MNINNAEPDKIGNFSATIALVFNRHFKYGNFDNSDDEINANDLVAWTELLRKNPESWEDANIDGFTGIDLMDVLTMQENWGSQKSSHIEDNKMTIRQLLELFGFTLTNEEVVRVPDWIDWAEGVCR